MGKPHTNGKTPDSAAPYSEEAEEAVIGSILVNPEMFPGVSSFLKADDFYLVRHRYIWRSMVNLSKRAEPIDYLTLMNELKTQRWLDDIGGAAYITKLTLNTPTSSHAEYYGRMVERTAKRRRLMTLADELKTLALDESLDIHSVMGKAEAGVMALTDDSAAYHADVTLYEAIQEHIEETTRATENPNHFDGVKSSIPDLNEVLQGGYGNGQFILGAGRPGMGKSSWLVAEAIHAAKSGRVYLCTLEMSRQQVTGMILAKVAQMEPLKMIRGRMTPVEYTKYLHACKAQADAIGRNLIINDDPNMTPAKLKRNVRRQHKQGGLAAVFMDYAQLMTGGNEDDYHNRVEELAYITRSLKKLARELNIPVLAAAQINRNVESQKDKRPSLSDLRESGSLENDTDIVLMFYRDAYYNPIEPPQEFDILEIIPRKGREVELRTVTAGFWGKWKMVAPIETRRLEPEL